MPGTLVAKCASTTTRPRLSSVDAGFLEAEPFGERHAADRDQHDIGLDGFRRAALGRLDLGLQRLAGRIDAGDLRAELEGHALLFEQALRLARRPRRPCPAGCGRGIRPPSPCAPSRRHTEPSSSPITPAPTTSSCSGTLSSASAPVEETMRLLVDRRCPCSCATSEPVAMTMFLVSSVCVLPSAPFTSTLPARRCGRCRARQSILFFLSRKSTPLTLPSTRLVLEFQHASADRASACRRRCPSSRSCGRPPRTFRRHAAAPSTGCSRR